MNQQNLKQLKKADHIAAIAEALFIANLLFIGVVYIALWVLYLVKYKTASAVSKSHLKQTLIASTISTLIVLVLNIIIVLTSGYASATALIMAEMYLMLVVPVFLVIGIFGFTKAVNEQFYKYPLIGRLAGVETDS
ncbi:MAG: hypothetical protein V3U76_14115 [Granulosicoccus sp.]